MDQDRKIIIIPTEIRVCATCSYWDGPRKVDEETRVVVVGHTCAGECLVRGHDTACGIPADHLRDCAWEPIASDEESPPAEDKGG